MTSLCSLAREDDRIVLVTADLGFGALEPFAAEFPSRFFNVGVAEQGMVAAATGLAEAGFVPYCYSIATFSSLRVIEFVRNGPVAHGLPVRLVGIGAGMDYGLDGLTHFAIDDLSMYLSQPGVLVWAPASNSDVADNLCEINEYDGPVYIRLVRQGDPSDVLDLAANMDGSAPVRVLSLGDAHSRGSQIAGKISNLGIAVDHRVVSRLESFGDSGCANYLSGASCCIVVESHYVYGGLASYVSQIVACLGLNCLVVPVGVERLPIGSYGNKTYMEEMFMTSDEKVLVAVKEALGGLC